MDVRIVRKGKVEVIHAKTITVVRYENLLVVVRSGHESETLKALPESVRRIVEAVVERVEPSE